MASVEGWNFHMLDCSISGMVTQWYSLNFITREICFFEMKSYFWPFIKWHIFPGVLLECFVEECDIDVLLILTSIFFQILSFSETAIFLVVLSRSSNSPRYVFFFFYFFLFISIFLYSKGWILDSGVFRSCSPKLKSGDPYGHDKFRWCRITIWKLIG